MGIGGFGIKRRSEATTRDKRHDDSVWPPKPVLSFLFLNCGMELTLPTLTLADGNVLSPEKRPEVERLRKLFEVTPAEVKERKVRLPGLKLSFQRPVRLMDMRRMYFYRHGTEQSSDEVVRTYNEVARKLYLPISTVYQAIKRYEGDGLKFLNRRRNNFKNCNIRKRKLVGPLKDYLLSYQVLTEWAPFSLL